MWSVRGARIKWERKPSNPILSSTPLITQRQSLLGQAEIQFFLHFTSLKCYRTALRTLEESVFQISRPFLSFPHLSTFVMKTTTLFLPFLTAILPFLPSANAHGFVHVFGVDGNDNQGNVPEGNDAPSPIRQVSSQDPLYGATNPSINCGAGAPNAALAVDAMPGSKLSWDWRTQSLSFWPHDTGVFSISLAMLGHGLISHFASQGPMLTYLASCGSTTCDQFDARTAKWFKIDQAGQDGNGGWVQKKISKFLPSPPRTCGLILL